MEVIYLSYPDSDGSHRRAVREMYLEGECYAFALALWRGLATYGGWRLVGLLADKQIRHAALQSTTGPGYFDARGMVSEEDFGRPFGLKPPYRVREVREDELLRLKGLTERDVELAGQMIETIWPELDGWQSFGYLARARRFIKGLASLSSGYHLYLCAPDPEDLRTWPVLFEVEDGVNYSYEMRFGCGEKEDCLATYLEQRESGKGSKVKTVPRDELSPQKNRFLIGLERLGRDTGIRPSAQLPNPSLKPLVKASKEDFYYEISWALNFTPLVFGAKEKKEK